MRTRTLGRSGVSVGEVGLGTWGISGEGYGSSFELTARATLPGPGIPLDNAALGINEPYDMVVGVGKVENSVGADRNSLRPAERGTFCWAAIS